MKVTKAACIGGGVIGAGWVARLIENSIDVAIYDPAPDAREKMQAVLDNADRAYAKLTMAARPKKGKITFAKSIAAAVKDAQWIVESVPERLDIKQKVYADIEKAADAKAIIASSTSGIMPTDLQAKMTTPARLLVAHPFNPVYLLPVVEIVGGKKTSKTAIRQAMAFYDAIGMKPVHHRQGNRGLRRRPPAGGDVAREPVADQGRHLHHAGNRRHRALRLRSAHGADGPVRDLPRGWRRGRHAPFHGPVRPLPDLALDQADGRAGVQRRTGRPHRRAIRRAVRPPLDPRAGAHPRRQPRRHPASAQGQ